MLRLHYDRVLVDQAPLPPHERTWRHPSELAAEQRSALRSEAAPRATRIFAFATGSAGLMAIALLMLVMTPGRSGQPLVVSATTSPAGSATPQALGVASTLIEQVRGFGRTAITPARALATPIGSGTHAVVLSGSLPDPLALAVEVELPTGHESMATVVERTGGVVVVELAVHGGAGHDVADQRPRDREIVTVMSSPPVTIAFADVHELEVADGTAVLDSDGELVALCDDERDRPGTRVVEISPSVAATSDEP